MEKRRNRHGEIKMKNESIWRLKQLMRMSQSVSVEIDDEWTPARPINYKFYTLRERIHAAWMVFTRKAEAFVWPKGQ
jgi:hypothetical protein